MFNVDPVYSVFSTMSLFGLKKLPSVYIVVLVIAQFVISQGAGNEDNDVFRPHLGQWDTLPKTGVATGVDGLSQLGKEDVVLLWWTGRLMEHSRVLEPINCPESKCYRTTDRSMNYVMDKRVRGFIFYGTDLDLSDLPLPRMPHHEWALFHEESPYNNYVLVHGKMIKLFNHTATFRRESDFPLTTQHIPSLRYLTQRKPLPVSVKNELKRTKKLAPVLYVQSNCDVPSDRDRYVKKLDRFIKVDSYGKCFHNRDLPERLKNPVDAMHHEEFIDLISQYKFVIAFENALCTDYMTEKLFRVLHAGSVPIYRGSSSVKDWMPNDHSVVLADEFESPEKLADYLYQLDNDDEAYERFLDYKFDGITNKFLVGHMNNRGWKSKAHQYPDMIQAFECYVCDKVTERWDTEQIHQVNPNFPLMAPHSARMEHLHCPQPYTSVGHPDDYKKHDGWKKMHWIEDYWGGMDKAHALNMMLARNETDSSTFEKYWDEAVKSRH